MNKDSKDSSPVTQIEYAVTYTCSTPGCVNPDGVQNFEVVTIVGLPNIPNTMRCPACDSDMARSKTVKAGGVLKEIWT